MTLELREALYDTRISVVLRYLQTDSERQPRRCLEKQSVNMVVTISIWVALAVMNCWCAYKTSPSLPVLLMTAYGDQTSNAVNAMRNGAVDYLVKTL